MVLSQILTRPGDENSSSLIHPAFLPSDHSWDEHIHTDDLLRIVLPEQICSAQSKLRERKIVKKLPRKKMSDSSVLRDLTTGKKKYFFVAEGGSNENLYKTIKYEIWKLKKIKLSLKKSTKSEHFLFSISFPFDFYVRVEKFFFYSTYNYEFS